MLSCPWSYKQWNFLIGLFCTFEFAPVCGAEQAAATPPQPHPRCATSPPHIHHGLTPGRDGKKTQLSYVASYVSLVGLGRILANLYKLPFQLPLKKQQVWGRQTLPIGLTDCFQNKTHKQCHFNTKTKATCYVARHWHMDILAAWLFDLPTNKSRSKTTEKNKKADFHLPAF